MIELHYHPLRSEISEGKGRDIKLSKRGWVGVSLNSISKIEQNAIQAYCHDLAFETYMLILSNRYWDSDNKYGQFQNNEMGIWFSDEALRVNFINALNQNTLFRPRVHEIVLPAGKKTLKRVKELTKGINRRLVTFEESNVLVISMEDSPAKAVEIKLACS